jgi:hypothetical protein
MKEKKLYYAKKKGIFILLLLAFSLMLVILAAMSTNKNTVIDETIDQMIDANSVNDLKEIPNDSNISSAFDSNTFRAGKENALMWVDYNLMFGNINVKMDGKNFSSSELGKISLFGTPQNIVFLVNGSIEGHKILDLGPVINSIQSEKEFDNNLVTIIYDYDPQEIGGSYCIQKSCVVTIYPSYAFDGEVIYSVTSNFLLRKSSLYDNPPFPTYILSTDGFYEKNGFLLLKEQEGLATSGKLNFSQIQSLKSRTENLLEKNYSEKIALFLIPEGLTLGGEYIEDSNVLLLRAVNDNSTNNNFVHEYTHFLFNGNNFPMWLQEGIPMYIANKVTNSKPSVISSSQNLLDWGRKDFDSDTVWKLYEQAYAMMDRFEQKFGEEKTLELIKEFESLPDDIDVYSEQYYNLVKEKVQEVSGQKISLFDFANANY